MLLGFVWPLAALPQGKRPTVSDHFDRFGIAGHRQHLGADIMYPRGVRGEARPPEFSRAFFALTGTPVLCVGPGRIHAIDRTDRHGIMVMVDHGGTAEGPRVSVYRHLATALALAKGTPIAGGSLLGTVGRDVSQGDKGLNHLHFEWWDTSRARGPGQSLRDAFAIDPTDLLRRVPVRSPDGRDLPPDFVSGAGAADDPGEDTTASGADGAAGVLIDAAFIPGGI